MLTLTMYTYVRHMANVGNGEDINGQSLVRGSETSVVTMRN